MQESGGTTQDKPSTEASGGFVGPSVSPCLWCL